MKQKERTLTLKNTDPIIQEFVGSIKDIGISIKGKTGLGLLEALKREKLKGGPYPGVTLFEAANRIMTDLVILHGVAWLLKEKVLPFDSYTVEFGNEDKNGFDIKASANGKTLIGEAFNVAPSFFQSKKSSMLKKLRHNGKNADYRIIMVNDDAVTHGYAPKREAGFYYVVVNVASGKARIVPNKALQPTSLLTQRRA
jgi:hypothetical protein